MKLPRLPFTIRMRSRRTAKVYRKKPSEYDPYVFGFYVYLEFQKKKPEPKPIEVAVFRMGLDSVELIEGPN